MASLENRLQETEIALHTALRAVNDQIGLATMSSHLEAARSFAPVFQHSKAEKQKSWRRQPLQTSEDVVAWFEERHIDAHNAASLQKHVMDQARHKAHTTSTIEYDHLPARGPSPFAPPSDAMAKLSACKRPLAPNVPYSSASSTGWLDRYF
ncbi:hypothetical protein DE146DRAFT_756586 [Phaeosphaeria sp. MPI-PUGE-AT-0046c]|nr:hypothetical protein DE146DRAFT_756586 [Phaeosphaeria sp. MPI-PUGE-AT-0046c]